MINLGWGGKDMHLKSNNRVYFADYVPHDWLFPRVRAVVHHGGAGTTAAGLRYGKPQRPSKDDIRYVGHSSGRGVDKFVIIAVVAALLAVGAIVYGWLSSREQDDIYGYDEDPIEQVDAMVDEMIEQTETAE